MTRTALSRFIVTTVLSSAVHFSTPGYAQTESEKEERWYQAEIIVFEIREKNATESEEIPLPSGEEIWPDDPGLPDYEGVIELSAIEEPLPLESEGDLLREASGPDQEILVNGGTLSETIDESLQPPLTAIEPAPLKTEVAADEVPVEVANVEQPFRLLPNEELTLTEIAALLDNSPSYVPIVHIAWRQPVPPKEQATRLYLHSNLGQLPTEEPLELATIDELMQPQTLVEPPLLLTAPDDLEPAPGDLAGLNTLDGTLTLHLGRYLHLEVDLLYRDQTEPLEPNTFFVSLTEEELPQTLFRMHQSRRMRSEELHYFDHPMFGMLAKLTPYELPEPEVVEPVDEMAEELLDEESLPANPESTDSDRQL